MREILFKAKRIGNGEWVEGNLIIDEQNESNVFIGYVSGTNPDETIDDVDLARVDPLTICQSTGLTDKNGQKIWENDVVEITQENGKFIIEWNETEAKWQMNNYAEEFIVDFDNYWSYNTEVIGNIFDNPELINE